MVLAVEEHSDVEEVEVEAVGPIGVTTELVKVD